MIFADEILIILPIALPLLASALMLFFRNSGKFHRAAGAVTAALMLAVSVMLLARVLDGGIIAVTAGGWKAPFGISLVADIFSALMVILSSLMGLASFVFSFVTVGRQKESYFYYPLLLFLMMGINGAFLTGDIFNMYVWYEVMLISSFVLLALGGARAQLEGAIKYVVINLISSGFFLAAAGMLFGLAGTLNMADLSVKIPLVESEGMVAVTAMFFLISFGIKSAIFPLFFWLPSSYHTPPAAVSAIFAGMLTKVGVYSMIRIFTLVFTTHSELINTIILVLAGLTMVTGVLGAAAQMESRKILSFHIISQIGYMILGLGLYTPLAIAGAVFYIAHHIVVKTNLFLISGIINEMSGAYLLRKLGGLYKLYPLLGLLFLIPALSLAGIPPLSGFWAKLMLAKAGFGVGQYLIIGVSFFVGLLTLYSMSKIWNEAFWKDAPDGQSNSGLKGKSFGFKLALFSPSVALAAITLIIGLYSEPLFTLAESAAAQILGPELYIEAVLGPGK